MLLRDIAYVVFKRKTVLITLLVVGLVIVVYGTMTVVPTYQAKARVLIKRVAQAYAMPTESRAVLRRSEVVNSELQIIMSSAVAELVVDRLGLAGEGDRSLAIHSLERRIQAKALPESDIIDISYRDKDAEMSALVVNTSLDAYLEIRKNVALNVEAVTYLDGQAHRLRAARDSIAMQIAEFGGDRGQLLQDVLAHQHMGLSDRFNNQLLTVQSNIETRRGQLALVEAWLASDAGVSEVPTADIYEMSTVREAKIQLVGLMNELGDSRARYAPGHPEIERLEREVTELERVLRREVVEAVERQRMELAGWEAEERAIENTLDQLRSRDPEISEEQLIIRMLEHELSIRADLYAIVMDRREQFRITAATDPNLLNVGIVSRAQVPARPMEQPVNMKVVVGIFTILFGFMLVFGLEKTDHSLERREEVQQHLGVKVLASIPDRR
jgi:uncharacterized protein involved in exopolysaccharide biosynthesis